MHGGELYDSRHGKRMARGKGALAEQIKALFELSCRKLGMNMQRVGLSTDAFRRPGGTQRLLFE